MAFDASNQDDLNVLRTEVDTDPAGMGYDRDSTTGVLAKLNDPEGNTTKAVRPAPLTVQNVMMQIDLVEIQALPQSTLMYMQALVSGRSFDESLEPFRSKLAELFGSESQSAANLLGLSVRLSRAEELYGVGTVIGRQDWLASL